MPLEAPVTTAVWPESSGTAGSLSLASGRASNPPPSNWAPRSTISSSRRLYVAGLIAELHGGELRETPDSVFFTVPLAS